MGASLWYLSRATGVASIVLLTVVVVLGVLVSGRRRPHGENATVVMAVHRWLSLGMVAFLAMHVLTAVVDSYVDVSALAVLVPFASSYETFWVGLGTLAVDILVAVLLTSWWRHRLRERAWRVVHRATYLLWPIALVHGFVLGTTSEMWLLGATVLSGAVGVAAILWRLLARPHHDRARRDVVLEQEWT
jgi:sulfoxide reductase heme-binding subunit YedZ